MNHPETGQHLPLVPPVSLFDGGPHASENCAAASMARLRRYMTGIPTTGTQVRNNQSDQDGGISIPDALCALRRMAPIVRPNWAAPYDMTAKPNPINRIAGATTSAGIIHLLEEGNMVVMQGDYGNLPVEWREQKTFTDDHAFTIDAVFGTSSTRAGYVVDTIPHYGTGYQGRVIPWTALLQYAYGLAGNGRIFAAWGKPPAIPKPPDTGTGTHTVSFKAHAEVVSYDLKPVPHANACILKPFHQEDSPDKATSAPCEAPAHRVTCEGDSSATTVLVLKGKYAGKHIRVGPGISVAPR